MGAKEKRKWVRKKLILFRLLEKSNQFVMETRIVGATFALYMLFSLLIRVSYMMISRFCQLGRSRQQVKFVRNFFKGLKKI